jgi:sugar lactone lactonase YvrE
VEYLKTRINVFDFIYSLDNVTILDDNIYLIKKQLWVQGNENFILIFDEVEGKYYAKYTNISAFTEITKFEDGYIAINDDEDAIINFTFNEGLSNDDYYYFDVEDLTAGLEINGVNDLVVDYDGSIYFRGVDNFINDITGSILDDGTVIIDTEIVIFEIVRLRPIN